MPETNGFTIARKGYTCSEVDEYIKAAIKGEESLRESVSDLQMRCDKLLAENADLTKRLNKANTDCATLAAAVAEAREKAAVEPDTEELDELRAQLDSANERCAELEKENEKLRRSEGGVPAGEAASSIVAEVTEVVAKIEKDARRKAEALTLSAKMEQARAHLVRERVNDEIASLIDMLNGFLQDGAHAPENTEEKSE